MSSAHGVQLMYSLVILEITNIMFANVLRSKTLSPINLITANIMFILQYKYTANSIMVVLTKV